MAAADLKLSREHRTPEISEPTHEIGVVEAIVGPSSTLVDRSAEALALFDRFQVNLIAVSRRGKRIEETPRLFVDAGRRYRGRAGQSDPFARGAEGTGSFSPCCSRHQARCVPAEFCSALHPHCYPDTGCFQCAPGCCRFLWRCRDLILCRCLNLGEAYEVIDWPILVMLGALIPVSETLRTTGGTDIIAGWLSHAAAQLPTAGALMLVMLSAMVVTPFLNNAATVLVMAPIAASFAGQLGNAT